MANATLDSDQYRVLVVEDEVGKRSARKSVLEHGGDVQVDVAEDEAAAMRQLAANDYDAVLVDVNLGPRGKQQGDQWLLREAGHLKDAYKVVVTGYKYMIKDENALAQQKIPVLVKGDPEEEQLNDELRHRANEKRRLVTARMRAAAQPLGRAVAPEAAALFLDWLHSRKDQEAKDIWIGGRNLSLKELADEVSHETELGRRLLEMFLLHMRRVIGLR